MGIDLRIYGTRLIIVPPQKFLREAMQEVQEMDFEAWSLPSEDVRRIANSVDPRNEYVEYIQRQNIICEGWYDEISEEHIPQINISVDHIKALSEWIDNVESAGYTVKFEGVM